MNKPLTVMWLGLRGFPNVQGGVETHAEQICSQLVQLGCDVHVICRSTYQSKTIGHAWHGVIFHSFWVPRLKGWEAILHTLLGVLYAGIIRRPDILHIQSIGPAIMVPLARFLGLNVVVTNHGPDYDRQKWGFVAKLILHLGEWFGMRWANERIVISDVIRKIVWEKYGLKSVLIPNGVVLSELPSTQAILGRFGLASGRYVLLVSRLVPEKRHAELIEAFKLAAIKDWKLVIVGAIDHPDAYVREVLKVSKSTPGVVCTGFQSGQDLRELYAHAGLFVLPSSHEGLSITILEALSYGLPVIASDIPANREIGLPLEHYFPLGNVAALAAKLNDFAARPLTRAAREIRRRWVYQHYDWLDITRRTLAVYQTVVAAPSLSHLL
jgi:glycosyltransferase involved in cell wall biosynthesis